MALSIDIQAGSDCYLYRESPTSNASGVIPVGEDNSFVELYRSLLRFDFSSIQPNILVHSATLTLTYSEAGSFRSSNNRTLNVYRVLRAWNSAQATWNVYTTGNNWGTAGCSDTTTDRSSSAIGTVTCNTTDADESTKAITLDASIIQQMIQNSSLNNGFLLQMSTESSDRFQFHNFTDATQSKRPKLTLSYTPVSVAQFF